MDREYCRLWVGRFIMTESSLHLLTPPSVNVTGSGSSATISTQGSVVFTSCATVSLNGIFPSGYHNFMVVTRHIHASEVSATINMNYRSLGVDQNPATYDATGIRVNESSFFGFHGTALTSGQEFFATSSNQASGSIAYFYSPNETNQTLRGELACTARSIGASGSNGGFISDTVVRLGTSGFDGFTLTVSTGLFSGRIVVYGMRK